MAFEVWDIQDPQWLEAGNIHAAVMQSIGNAAVTGKLAISELPKGSSDITVPEIQKDTGEHIGITVCSPHLALCYGGRKPPKHRRPEQTLEYTPHLVLMPHDYNSLPLYRSRKTMIGTHLQLFRYVRYVEATPDLSEIAARLQQT